ncbi:Poly(ADP-ribose) glycohydrolase 1 [Eumeta japonica]|uniref:Poly(ADP-ribose) glycohydrolase 1 n=1 Tax=Eumeta variegata TaxID=151549 RepID=A0A4C1U901_EUMVA|nr:Poly(ADP-ribose) glycohydrolase 1 [Eumeta japonica]
MDWGQLMNVGNTMTTFRASTLNAKPSGLTYSASWLKQLHRTIFVSGGSEDEGRGESARPNSFGYSKELSTEERRLSFAGRLREALRREAEDSCTTSTGDWSTDSSSYAVGISISGAGVNDQDIRHVVTFIHLVKRGGSVGFVLTDRETVSNGAALSPRKKPLGRKETGNSSKYSFSTEYTSSELEEVYEQFNQWLNDPIIDAESGEHKQRELDQRDLAVIRFAGSLLKRTLSESCTGAGAGAAAGTADAAELYGRDPRDRPSPRRLVLAARSLSLELARHRHRLAAHLVIINALELCTVQRTKLCRCEVSHECVAMAQSRNAMGDWLKLNLRIASFAGNSERQSFHHTGDSSAFVEVGLSFIAGGGDDPLSGGLSPKNSIEKSKSSQTPSLRTEKRKVRETIPEEILESVRHTPPDATSPALPGSGGESSSDDRSTDTCKRCPDPRVRKRKLNWVISMIVEAIEETVECEPVTIKLGTPKLKQLAHKMAGGGPNAPVATGNWGCGRRQRGEPQLKLLLQWLAASVAGLPALIYYTCGNEKLFKLDTVVRVLVDRKWSVGQLAQAVLTYARQRLHTPHALDSHSLFDELIGIEKIPDD